MKVLLVLGHNLGWRTYAATLTTALERRSDVAVDIVGGGRAAGGAGRGVATAPRHRELTRLVRDLRLAPGLRRSMREAAPDVVHAAGHLMARPLLWPGIGAGAPLSLLLDGTARQSDRAKGVAGGIGRWAWRDEAELFRRAGLVNCVSGWAASSVLDDYGVDAERVRVRPYPIADPTSDGPRRPRSSSVGATVRLLFVAGDFERKGGEWLLRTFAERWVDRATLSVVSDTAPRDGLPPGVQVFRGVDNDAVRRDHFPHADLLVHPTRFDQSSMVAIEAAAFGIPAVVSDVGGVGEVVEDGRTGVVAHDDAEFSAGVDRLIDRPDLREAMGAAGRVRFLEHHEADRSVGRMLDDWRALVEGP